MLRIIGILFTLVLSSNAFSQEYIVVVSDDVTGEVVVEKCENEAELNAVSNYIKEFQDGSLSISVKKLKMPISVMAIKKGGGEGSGD